MSSSSSQSNEKQCGVCIETYNKRRVDVTCSSCDYSVCVCCIKQYLLTSADDPHCMNCRKGWDRDTQYNLLGKSFVNGDLRKHRKQMLYEREKAMFPSTQSYIDTKVAINTLRLQESEVEIQIQQLCTQRYNIRRERYNLETTLTNGNINSTTKKNEQLLKCPHDDCRGYISHGKSECGLCSSHICRKCMVIVPTEDALKSHECDKDTLATAQLIFKSSKPCPTCGTRISKVNGCDQMWCPECDVAFSWTTGMKVNGVIHNPHFYEYQRLRNKSNSNVNLNRNEGDVVCGGLVSYSILDRFLRKGFRKWKTMDVGMNVDVDMNVICNSIYECHRITNHFQDITVNRIRRELQREVNHIGLRADFMMGNLTEEQFLRAIVKRDNDREKKQSIIHIYETLVTMFTERINNYVSSNNLDYDVLVATYQELKKCRDYIQKQLVRVSKNYNVQVECFVGNQFDVSTYKDKRICSGLE